MRLLIITQKVNPNDDVLGFFYRWIEEFAKHAEKVSVIALEADDYKSLPNQVEVYGLGKPAPRLFYIWRFFKYLFKLNREYDFVFVHMNPIYLVLAGWWFRLNGKKVALWYTHRQVDLKLRIAEKFSDIIFSAAPESFRLKSEKVKFVGHGIDVAKFTCNKDLHKREKMIIHVGRITQIKNCEILIEAFSKLKSEPEWQDWQLVFLGQPATSDDEKYFSKLKEIATGANLVDSVIFAGSVPNKQIMSWYCRAQISVNLTPTGGVDKSVLESMASGTGIFTSNEAFKDYFGDHLAAKFIFNYRDPDDLVSKIKNWSKEGERQKDVDHLRQVVFMRAGVEGLVSNLVQLMLGLKR